MKKLISTFILTIISFSGLAQNKVVKLEDKFYISVNELTTLNEIIKNAPIIEEYCIDEDCSKINNYFLALHNLKADLYEYKKAMRHSYNVSHKQWYLYLDENYKNENLKKALLIAVGHKEYWNSFASSVLDLASAWSALENSGPSALSTESFDLALKGLDLILVQFNIAMNAIFEGEKTSFIGAITSEEWNTAYTGFRAVYEGIRECYALYKKLDDVVDVSADEIKNLKRVRKANLAAAILQIVNMYSAYESKQMRDHVKELDKVLAGNQSVQSQHYQKSVLKRAILDEIEKIEQNLNLRYGNIKILQQHCGNAMEYFKRNQIVINENKFGDALIYYRSLLPKWAEIVKKTYQGISNCELEQKKYLFKVLDGLGKISDDKVYIQNAYSHKNYGEVRSNQNTIRLYPGDYNFILSGQTNYSAGYNRGFANYDSYPISGKEPELQTPSGRLTEIILNPYGRLEVEVEDNNGIAQSFKYVLGYSGSDKSYKWGGAFHKLELDIPHKNDYSLRIDILHKEKKIEHIKLSPGRKTKVKVIFDNIEFKEVFIETSKPIKPDVAISDLDSTIKNDNVVSPKGYTIGTLYNSNDGKCSLYSDKYLEFLVRDQKIYDFSSKSYKNIVVVAPGEKKLVAVPTADGHFRVTPFDPEGKERSFSFWYYNDLTKGWWYAAGCKNGTKPKSNCNDGTKDANSSDCVSVNDDF